MTGASIRVACATNAAYLPHAATLIESLASAHPARDVQVSLLHDASVTETDVSAMVEHAHRIGVDLECLQPAPSLLERLPPARTYPPLIWYRLLLPELLPEVDRLLYLDVDTLVLQDLGALFERDMKGHPVAAVESPRSPAGDAHRAQLGFESVDTNRYFNSGVLMMDLSEMRRRGFTAEVFRIGIDRATELRFPDQDALNLACQHDWLVLPPKWNALSSLYLDAEQRDRRRTLEYLEAVASPAILHFEGTALAKPWHARCIHPWRDLYLQYRARTPWPLVALEGDSWISQILRRLPLRTQLWVAQARRR